MNPSAKRLAWTGLVVAGFVSLWPSPAPAGHEAVGVYEDWGGSSTLRSDRWLVREDGQNEEIALGIQGHRLTMRNRREGATASDAGSVGGVQALLARNLSNIDRMEADLRVRNLEVSGCAANPGQTLVRPALLAVSAFNDGTSDAGQTGDHAIQVQVNGPIDTVDAASVLTVQANVVRCLNAACTIGSSPVFALGIATLPISTPFTLRAAWDRPNHRFLVGVNADPDVELAYDAALDTANARVPFASVRTAVVTANCTAGHTTADVEVEVGEVRTNVSAIVP